MKVFIGIDPGNSTGGLAYIHGEKVITAAINKLTEKEIFEFLENAVYEKTSVLPGKEKRLCFALIEKVHAMPKQGVSSSFSFGQNYGALKMALTALGIPYEEVQPKKWQALYSMKRDKEESKTDWKRRLKEKSQMLFPDIPITNSTADAILIANYCREIKKG